MKCEREYPVMINGYAEMSMHLRDRQLVSKILIGERDVMHGFYAEYCTDHYREGNDGGCVVILKAPDDKGYYLYIRGEGLGMEEKERYIGSKLLGVIHKLPDEENYTVWTAEEYATSKTAPFWWLKIAIKECLNKSDDFPDSAAHTHKFSQEHV